MITMPSLDGWKIDIHIPVPGTRQGRNFENRTWFIGNQWPWGKVFHAEAMKCSSCEGHQQINSMIVETPMKRHERITTWMKQWTSQPVNQRIGFKKKNNGIMNEQINYKSMVQRLKGPVKQRAGKPTNHWLKDPARQWSSESINQWSNEAANHWLKEPVGQWIKDFFDSMHQWMVNDSVFQ